VIAFQLAWPQFAFANMNADDSAAVFGKIFNIALALGCWLVLGIALFAGAFIQLAMAGQFTPAIAAVVPLALGMLMYGAFYFFMTADVIEKKTAAIIIPLSLALATDIVLNIFLTPRFGFQGTAWAAFSAYTVMALTMYLRARRSRFVALDWPRLLRLLAPAALLVVAASFWMETNTKSILTLKVLVFLSFPFILRITGFVNQEFMGRIKQLMHGSSVAESNGPTDYVALEDDLIVTTAPLNSEKPAV
jgi:O-antigen/teichoic acid export membrane protein